MYGLNRLSSATLSAAAAAAAAQIYRKRLSPLRSIPICRRSLSSAAETYKRKRLPPKLSAGTTAELTCESSAPGGVCDVYVIGTTHNAPESCEQVKAVIQFVKPQVVFLECPHHTRIHDISEKCEFYVGYEAGRRYGAKIVLGDRPDGITMRRLPIIASVKEFLSIPFKESRKDFDDMVKKTQGKVDASSTNLAMGWAAKMIPSAYTTLVDERDQFMATILLEVARKHKSVVAIVGRGHVQGMQDYWKQPVDMQQLLHIPIGKRMFTTFEGIVSIVAIISGIYILKVVVL